MILTVLISTGFHAHLARAAAKKPHLDARVFSAKALIDPAIRKEALERLAISDSVLIEAGEEPFWAELNEAAALLEGRAPVIRLSWGAPGESGPGAAAAALISQGGEKNALLLWELLEKAALGLPFDASPDSFPAHGFWHPKASESFYPDIESFLKWADEFGLKAPFAALITHRHYLRVDQPLVETALIEALEKRGLSVIGVFLDQGLPGAEDPIKFLARNLLEERNKPAISLIVKLSSMLAVGPDSEGPSFLGDDSPSGAAVRLYRKLNIPVLQPVVSHRLSPEEWEADPAGLGPEVSWSMTLPEFEGVIEPVIVGGNVSGAEALEGSSRKPILERVDRLADRAARLYKLSATPPKDRKIALILHNAPCASVEATVGTASQLDAFESIRELAIRLAKEGYQIEPPESGKALIETIMAKKAISEFRWTTAQEIVHKGGALARVCLDDYLSWFEKFPESVRQRLTETWGEPPGRETDGVPAAMVYEESIIVTGVPLGPGAVVMLQPKRGCAGSRCDGRVCKILHDPVIPPPHQFLATYKWIADNERGFGAHAIIHVGTHGCLEYLPGKSIGLSEECLPDLAMGDLPHLYLYNCAVTADGLIAKRRSYASIVDHLQPPMVKAGLSGELEELFSLIGQWEGVRPESERAKTIRELVVEKLSLSPLKRDLPDLEGDFAQVARALKGALRLAETSLVEDGLHVLGRVPEGKRLSSAVKGIVRFDSGDKPSLRSLIAGSLGLDLGELLREELSQDPLSGPGREGAVASKAAALIDSAADSLVDALLEGESLSKALPEAISSLGPLSKLSEGREPPAQAEMDRLEARVKALKSRLEGSRELEGLSNGLNGGFITPGPSGFLTRGLDNVAPTGRNFYARDPRRVPTPAAVKVGWALAEAAVARHLKESGKPPRSVSFFWTSADLLQADGEVLAQMLALMGLRPRWDAAGLVSGVEAVTLSDLGRPRIDITCRMSGIVRDLFRPSYEYLDRAVKLAAGLDEPPECNLVRARTLEALAEERGSGRSETDSWRRATSRIFSQRPGSFEGGTYLAVMASAWETEADLAEIFLHHNSCAYGEDVYGLEAQDLLENQLRSVDVNFLSLMGDSQDFLGCGGFFGAQGGLAQAASLIQGRKIRNWCADSRESLAPQVRTISEEINRCLAARLLNPSWLKSMAGHGYKGAAEISRRVTNAYGWLATTGEVDDRALDRLVAAFFEDPELHGFLTENNPWALEEIGRRLLEANSRGLWKADPEALAALKEGYLSLEGVLEESVEAFGGDLQGGAVDIITSRDLPAFRQRLDEARRKAGLAPIGPQSEELSS